MKLNGKISGVESNDFKLGEISFNIEFSLEEAKGVKELHDEILNNLHDDIEKIADAVNFAFDKGFDFSDKLNLLLNDGLNKQDPSIK